MEDLESHQQEFVGDPLSDWEPVKFEHDWRYMSRLSCEGDDPGSSVLDSLKFVEFLKRKTGKNTVAIIKTRTDKGMDKFLSIGAIEVAT